MPTSAALFALLSGASAATWTICLKLGSTKINAALGAMVIAAVAFLVNSVAMLTMRAHGHEILLKQDAFWVLAFAGVAAAGVDIFALLAYERGLRGAGADRLLAFARRSHQRRPNLRVEPAALWATAQPLCYAALAWAKTP